MIGVILICRMGSSRFPGKTLAQFGDSTLVEHIVKRIEAGGVERKDIVLCTSNRSEDGAILEHAKQMGCKGFGGDPENVTQRIIDCATEYGFEDFLLVLGDNPWIDSKQINEIVQSWKNSALQYLVTATPELDSNEYPNKLYPNGTRLQIIKTDFIKSRFREKNSPETQEHTSRLFNNLPPSVDFRVFEPINGWDIEDIAVLNTSINTISDYEKALIKLEKYGPEASVVEIVNND